MALAMGGQEPTKVTNPVQTTGVVKVSKLYESEYLEIWGMTRTEGGFEVIRVDMVVKSK